MLRRVRVLKLVGQFKLFKHDIDSSSIDPDNEAAQRLRKRLKNREQDFSVDKKGCLQAQRELADRLLVKLEELLFDIESSADNMLRIARRRYCVAPQSLSCYGSRLGCGWPSISKLL